MEAQKKLGQVWSVAGRQFVTARTQANTRNALGLDRQTDRQTDRQAGRQTDSQADRQAGRQAGSQTGRQSDR